LVIKIISNDLESNYSMCTTNYIKEFRDDEIEVLTQDQFWGFYYKDR